MPRISTDRSERTPSVRAEGVVHLDGYGAPPDMTVLEFCAGMALARNGPLTARGIAAEISVWLGRPIRAGALRQQLGTLVRRGWAQIGKAGTYSLADAGTDALMSEASYAETHGFQISSDMSNLLQDRYETLQREHPEWHLPDLSNPHLDYRDLSRRDQAIAHVMDDLMGSPRQW